MNGDATSDVVIPPPVLWAQRQHAVYLTIGVEDCKDAKVSIGEQTVDFSGKGGDGKKYAVSLKLFDKIKSSESKFITRDRGTEFCLIKEKTGPFWPRLLEEVKKPHYVKVDFNKWVDEDDSEDETGGDFEEMMRKMGGLGDSGGMDFGDLDNSAGDSDDEELPELEAKAE